MLTVIGFCGVACSSLLYYPTSVLYVDPKQITPPPQEHVLFTKGREKLKLIAWHFSQAENTKPILVAFHGNGQNLSSHFQNLFLWVQNGFDLFIFDYPGYGGSEGSPSPQNTVDAGLAALDYVRQKWPTKKIIVVGQSLGGAVALRTLLEWQDRSSVCLIFIDSSFDSYQKVAQKILAKNWFTWPLQFIAYGVLSDRYAPTKRLHELSPIPLIFYHQKDDPVVPSEFSERLYSQANEPKKLLIEEGHGHVNAFYGLQGLANQKKLSTTFSNCSGL